MLTKVSPNAERATSVSGVVEPRNAVRFGAPKTIRMNGTSSNAMPISAALTTAWPTWTAEPVVSSLKLMALS